MNVLSLFDGISAGQLALQRSNILVDNYYASEIDKYAISITQHKFPSTIQLGNINNWKSWDLPTIELILAGFPCQSWSSAGLGLGLEDLRGQLIFPMLKTIQHYKPKYFLLENVKGLANKKNKPVLDLIISELESYGYSPKITIVNSALVSAQNRERVYITNWEFPLPEDKHIYLKDIIEFGEVDRDKAYCIDANYYKGGSLKMYNESARRQIVYLPKYQSQKRLMVKIIPHGYVKEEVKERDKYPSLAAQSSASKYLIQVGEAEDIKGQGYNRRVYSTEDKCPTLNTGSGGNLEPKIALSEITWRKLTPIECERLQTFPDDFTRYGINNKIISNTQRYKCIGNSWTVDVISHILSFMKNK